MPKYIVLDVELNSGLNDVKDRFADFLKISKVLNLIPIIPKKMFLTNSHTDKKNNSLLDYIKIPFFVLCNLPRHVNANDIFVYKPKSGFLPSDSLYKTLESKLTKIYIPILFQDKFRALAHRIISKMLKPVCVVHIRRGDYLNIHPSLHATTSAEHITKVLKRHAFRSLYLKTNEKNLGMYSLLKTQFNAKIFTDFQELQTIHASGDNYALYSVECCIRDLCDIRISTFNTRQVNSYWLPNNNSQFFSDYLDEHRGYQ